MTEKKRLKYIDVARGIAMLLIVLSHSLSVSTHALPVYRVLFFINVPIFFVLSGFTFRVKEGESFWKFLKNKMLRIMLPYFVWALVFLIPYLIFGNDIIEQFSQTSSFDLPTQIGNVFYGNGVNNALKQNGPLWFLPALFATELFYYAIVRYVKKWKGQLVVFVLSVAVGWLSTLFTESFDLPWGINSALTIGCFFYFGYLLKEWKVFERMSLKTNIIISLLMLTSCVVAIIFAGSGNVVWADYKYMNYPLMLLAGFSSSWLIIQIARMIDHNKVLEHVGVNTMPILIFHKIIIVVAQTKMGHLSSLMKDSNALLEIVLAIFVCVVTVVIPIGIGSVVRKVLPELIGEKRTKR